MFFSVFLMIPQKYGIVTLLTQDVIWRRFNVFWTFWTSDGRQNNIMCLLCPLQVLIFFVLFLNMSECSYVKKTCMTWHMSEKKFSLSKNVVILMQDLFFDFKSFNFFIYKMERIKSRACLFYKNSFLVCYPVYFRDKN